MTSRGSYCRLSTSEARRLKLNVKRNQDLHCHRRLIATEPNRAQLTSLCVTPIRKFPGARRT